MSKYVNGTIIEFQKKKFAILNNIEREKAEYLVVIPVKDAQKKWEDINSIEELNAEYDKLIVLTHNKENDEYKFETNRDILTDVFTETTKNVKFIKS